MAKALFVQKVANLEGYRNAVIAKPLFELTLDNVDARIIQLEKQCQVQSPPPMLEVTWESLEFRIKRLLTPRWAPSRQLKPTTDNETPVSVETLKKVLIRLDPRFITQQSAEEKIEPFNFDVAAQILCYVAGQYNWGFPDPIKDIQQLYAAAVELSLKIEAAPPPMPMGPNIRMGPPGRPAPFKSPKACCGCCSCHCHASLRPGGMPPSPPGRLPHIINIKSRKTRTQRRWSFFSWLKNPFAKKKRYDSDTESTSSGSDTDTLAD